MTVLDHPLYSPDLAPADYFLFPKVKSHLRGRLWLHFGHPESRDKYIKHQDEFYKGIQKLYDHANLCVLLEEIYVEN